MNERLKQLRASLGLTTRMFGEKIGVSGGAITNMEKGTRNITDRTVTDICREFGVSEHWLRTGDGEMYSCPSADSLLDELIRNPDLDDLDRKILSIYMKLPNEYKKLLKEHISQVAASFSLMPHPECQLSPEDQSIDYSEEIKDEKKA